MRYQNSGRDTQERGIILLEVMIALLVAAIALWALLQGLSQTVQTQSQLNLQAMAQQVAWQHWVALSQETHPEQGTQTVSQLGQTWHIETQLTPTAYANTQQVRIRVQAVASNAPVVQLSALVMLP